QDALAELSAMATEMLGATRTVKAFTQETVQTDIYENRSEESYRAEVRRLGARAILVALVIFLGTVARVAVRGGVAGAVFDGAVPAGQLARFSIYALMASGALTDVSEVFAALPPAAGWTERLMAILATKATTESPKNPLAPPAPSLRTVSSV